MRILSYADAINETLHQLLADDERVYLIGQGVKSPWYVGSTCNGLLDRFGDKRIIDTPVSECGITGAAIGSALAGRRPVVVHPRLDFMYYAMDPLVNHAANWHYMFGGEMSVPVTIWGIINRGGEQGAQHSQAVHAMYAHIPGLKVVMPSTPYDVKGLLAASVRDDNPVIFIDDRWLYQVQGDVPESLYTVDIGKGKIRREGDDVTIVALSYMVHEALEAAEILENDGISVEVVDPLTIKPLDRDIILRSVEKTGRLLIVDGGWKSFGASAEIAAIIAETGLVNKLRAPISRMALPDVPAPASKALEQNYYKKPTDIVRAVKNLMEIE